MNFIKTYEYYVTKKSKYSAKLAGVMLIIDNKILMIIPNKHKNQNKWSVPKGRIEIGQDTKIAAMKELREETGIKLPKEYFDDRKIDNIVYYKGKELKEMELYVVKLTSNNIEHKEIIDKIKNKVKNFTKNDEIYDCKLLDYNEAIIKSDYYYKFILKKYLNNK